MPTQGRTPSAPHQPQHVALGPGRKCGLKRTLDISTLYQLLKVSSQARGAAASRTSFGDPSGSFFWVFLVVVDMSLGAELVEFSSSAASCSSLVRACCSVGSSPFRPRRGEGADGRVGSVRTFLLWLFEKCGADSSKRGMYGLVVIVEVAVGAAAGVVWAAGL